MEELEQEEIVEEIVEVVEEPVTELSAPEEPEDPPRRNLIVGFATAVGDFAGRGINLHLLVILGTVIAIGLGMFIRDVRRKK